MTPKEIRAKRKDIDKRLREYDAGRKLIEAERLALQHGCDHPRMTSYNDGGGYGGPDFASTYYDCPDCGYHKSTPG